MSDYKAFSRGMFVLLFIGLIGNSLLAETKARITIIIDDLGNNHRLGIRAAKLPLEVALSILPHTSFSREIAELGHQRGMDILLHQPMESVSNVNLLGPGSLLSSMNRQEFNRTLQNNLQAVPFVIGVNNHMGSLLTADQQKMNWLMEELKLRDLFFIDSRTSTKTIAESTAKHWQLPAKSRKVFLDHLDQPEEIAKQFQRLLKFANKEGHAIAIGHPRLNTLAFLEQKLSQLDSDQYTLISVGELMESSFARSSKRENYYRPCYSFGFTNYKFPTIPEYPQLKHLQQIPSQCLVH